MLIVKDTDTFEGGKITNETPKNPEELNFIYLIFSNKNHIDLNLTLGMLLQDL